MAQSNNKQEKNEKWIMDSMKRLNKKYIEIFFQNKDC